MITLDGDKLGVNTLNIYYLGDLIYYEGPLLSIYKDRNNPKGYYLYKWCDNDNEYHRWAILKVSFYELMNFFNEKISLKSLMFKDQFIYFVDVTNSIEEKNMIIVSKENIPEDYTPSKNSFYNTNAFTTFAESFRKELQSTAITSIEQFYRTGDPNKHIRFVRANNEELEQNNLSYEPISNI